MASTAASKYPFDNLDLSLTRKEYVFQIPSMLKDSVLDIMTDKRDMPMIHLLFNIFLIVVPFAVFLYKTTLSGWTHLYGVAYLATFGFFLPRFILCMHYSSHRFVFKANTWYGSLLNNMQTFGLAPLFGIPSGMYYLHHVVMHHCEGNIFPEDWSSTMMYQRDNALHFFHYWLKFYTTTYFYLPYYAMKRGMYTLAMQGILGSVAYFFTLHMSYQRNPAATIYVLLLPNIITSFALMFGNWSQHMFLDPAQPESPYGCTFNAMNAVDNAWTFNDGYHIVHHVHSRLHWTEMPNHFMKNIQTYADEDCVVFDGLGFFDVGMLVMLGKLDTLAKHYVNWGFLGGKQRSHDEIIAMFKERLVPMPPLKEREAMKKKST